MFNMLVALPQFRLLSDFPPRTNFDPILDRDGILPKPNGGLEVEDRHALEREKLVRGTSSQVIGHTPMPQLEIPFFEGVKPKWWIRRCENFFEFYQISEEQKVTLAAAYLNDMANSW